MRREELGLNQDEVAHRLGINPRTYQKYEYGQAFPRPDKMAKLAEIFGVSAASLMGERMMAQSDSQAPDRASRILELQSKLMGLSDNDFDTVETMVNGLKELSQSEKAIKQAKD